MKHIPQARLEKGKRKTYDGGACEGHWFALRIEPIPILFLPPPHKLVDFLHRPHPEPPPPSFRCASLLSAPLHDATLQFMRDLSMRIIRRYRHHHDQCQDSAERFFAQAAEIAAEPPVPFAPLAGEPAAAAEGAAAGGGGGEGGEGEGEGEEAAGGEAEAGSAAVGADNEAVSSRAFVFVLGSLCVYTCEKIGWWE